MHAYFGSLYKFKTYMARLWTVSCGISQIHVCLETNDFHVDVNRTCSRSNSTSLVMSLSSNSDVGLMAVSILQSNSLRASLPRLSDLVAFDSGSANE